MTVQKVWMILKCSFADLRSKDPLRLAGATAFFTTFALPPFLIIIIQTFGLFYSKKRMKDGMFGQLSSVLGIESSRKLFSIFDRFQELAHNWLVALVGFVFLLFVATTLFRVVRTSVNELWNIKVETKAGIRFHIYSRLKSVLAIFVSGLLLVVQLLASGMQAMMSDEINELWSGYQSWIYKLVSQVIALILTTGWFTILFRYLANAHPSWRTALAGGLFTGIFFTLGKLLLGFLFAFGNLQTIFGAAGSFVLVLLFVFYTSFIFYFGAAFTRMWSEHHHKKMRLEKHAYLYKIEEVRSKKKAQGNDDPEPY